MEDPLKSFRCDDNEPSHSMTERNIFNTWISGGSQL